MTEHALLPATNDQSRPFLRSIRGKVIIRTLAVSLVPLIVLGGIFLLGLRGQSDRARGDVQVSRDALQRDVVGQDLETSAQSIGKRLDDFLAERVGDIADIAENPLVGRAAAAGSRQAEALDLGKLSPSQLDATYSSSPVSDPDAQTVVSLASETYPDLKLVTNGGILVASNTESNTISYSREPWFRPASDAGSFVGPVSFDDDIAAFGVKVAVRVQDPVTKATVGVLQSTLDVSIIQGVADEYASATNGARVSVATNEGLLLAETATKHNPNRMVNPEFAVVTGTDQAFRDALANPNRRGFAIGTEDVTAFARTTDQALTKNTDTPITGFNWLVFVGESNEVALAPLASVDRLSTDLESSTVRLTIVSIAALILAALAAGFVGLVLARQISSPIRRLRDAASLAATEGMPDAIRAVERGASEGTDIEPVNVATGDELDDLADAINEMQGTAVRLAFEQAAGRKNVQDMFVNLGRRNQNLLSRQLRFLDDLERNETNPELLDGLFKLDQLATRMRRNAESLLVLAGTKPVRRWTQPVAVGDVFRSAVSEIEAFDRIDVHDSREASVLGNAASDVSHLLAELLENATKYSDPDSRVLLRSRLEATNLIIEVEDQGIGIQEQALANLNTRLSVVQRLDEVPTADLGIFVVGRLRDRLGVTVVLESDPGAGTIARITIPPTLFETVGSRDGETLEMTPASSPAPILEPVAKIEPGLRNEQPDAPSPTPEVHAPDPVVEVTNLGFKKRESRAPEAFDRFATPESAPNDRDPLDARANLDSFQAGKSKADHYPDQSDQSSRVTDDGSDEVIDVSDSVDLGPLGFKKRGAKVATGDFDRFAAPADSAPRVSDDSEAEELRARLGRFSAGKSLGEATRLDPDERTFTDS